jgi:DNA-directed RNA polymerase
MLVRAARRKASSTPIRTQPYFEQLYLPWLCPAHITNTPVRRRWAATDASLQRPVVRKRRKSNDASNIPVSRSMATAVDSSTDFDEIPFESQFNLPRDSQIRPPHSFILGTGAQEKHVLPLDAYDTLAVTEQRLRRSKETGVTGEISQVLSVYYACLAVGKTDRAGVILARVLRYTDISPDGIISLHLGYLRACLDHIMLEPSEHAMQAIHRWFELEIRSNGIAYTAEMVAYVLKASLYAPSESVGGNKERLVKRYMDLVEGDAGLEALNAPFLTDRERNEVMQICPERNLAQNLWADSNDDIIPLTESLSRENTQIDDVPEVNAMPQKGFGLKSLKQALSLFMGSPSQGLSMGGKTVEEKKKIQQQLEEDSVNSAAERWRLESQALKKMGLDSSLQTKSVGARMWKWHGALEEHLKLELEKLEAAENNPMRTREDEERIIHGPFLRMVPVDKLAATTILATMGLLATHGADKGVALSRAIMDISGSVEDESVMQMVIRHKRSPLQSHNTPAVDVDNLIKLAKTRTPGSMSKIIASQQSSDRKGSAYLPFVKPWPTAIRAKVGAYVLSALIEIAKVPVTLENADTKETVTELQPALLHAIKFSAGRKLGIIMANQSLVESLKREPVHSLLAKHLPMLVEPDPWTSFNKGGYIVHPTKLIRIKNGSTDQRYYAEAAMVHGDLDRMCEGLNVLGKTEWRINKPVFDVMLKAWNTGEAIANFPEESPSLVPPEPPAAMHDPVERRRWLKAVRAVENRRTALHSQRCFQNFQLEIARALRTESFYFPHNVDFRGRAYPIPPYLNHMGADNCRGLLRFGKGKELGVSGLRWLKIHLANVYGFDKASLQEREDFSSNHVQEIVESTTNPLDGSRWWLNAEDPWQCLAACFELKAALDCEDPTQYVSHLPCHQDGTCNGLQHYAALGGDVWGAQQVNLEPGDRPADVYTAVADMVKEALARDKLNGNEYAAVLDGKIARKTVKQTVMTNVYGVTFIGARAQVRKQLIAAYPDLPNTSTMNSMHLASYVARHIFTALGTMFKGAHEIQYWFGECAGRISKSLTVEQMEKLEHEINNNYPSTAPGGKKQLARWLSKIEEHSQFKSTVIWTTPLNMPVVQPYRNIKTKSVSTVLQNISLMEPHRTDTISKRKQLQGFPPNFIHSLDATHMLLSALKSDEAGLSFAAVHDSFWTHAADIDQLNTILRDMFIDIHKEDVIGRLAAEFDVRYKDGWYLAQVHHTAPVANKIMDWRQAHKKDPKYKHLPSSVLHLHELLLERKRLRLLGSEISEEVEAGKAMVTPATIFADEAREGDVADDTDLSEVVRLGSTDMQPASSEDNSTEFGDDELVDDELADAEAGYSEPAPESTAATDVGQESLFQEFITKTQNKAKRNEARTKYYHVSVWLPLIFPPQPKRVSPPIESSFECVLIYQKGDFDVGRLRNSQYFFS